MWSYAVSSVVEEGSIDSYVVVIGNSPVCWVGCSLQSVRHYFTDYKTWIWRLSLRSVDSVVVRWKSIRHYDSKINSHHNFCCSLITKRGFEDSPSRLNTLWGPPHYGTPLETPKASKGKGMWKGRHPQLIIWSLGELRKLPQRGPGRSPGRKHF